MSTNFILYPHLIIVSYFLATLHFFSQTVQLKKKGSDAGSQLGDEDADMNAFRDSIADALFYNRKGVRVFV